MLYTTLVQVALANVKNTNVKIKKIISVEQETNHVLSYQLYSNL